MKAKSKSDPDEAKKLMSETHYHKTLGSDLKQSPTAGVIWDLKEKPCWDEIVEEDKEIMPVVDGESNDGPTYERRFRFPFWGN